MGVNIYYNGGFFLARLNIISSSCEWLFMDIKLIIRGNTGVLFVSHLKILNINI